MSSLHFQILQKNASQIQVEQALILHLNYLHKIQLSCHHKTQFMLIYNQVIMTIGKSNF